MLSGLQHSLHWKGVRAVRQSLKHRGCGVRILLVTWCVAMLKQCLRAALMALSCCLQKGCSVRTSATGPQHLTAVQVLIPDPAFAYWHLLMNVSFVTRCYQEPTHPPVWEESLRAGGGTGELEASCPLPKPCWSSSGA